MKLRNFNKIVCALLLFIFITQSVTYDEFIYQYNKPYVKGTEDYNQKQKVFNENVNILNQMNCIPCGVTKFFDMTRDQFRQKITNVQHQPITNPSKYPLTLNKDLLIGMPTFIDWRRTGVSKKVRDQGICGSSWAFAVAGMAESSLILKRLKNKKRIDLSEQYLIDCTKGGGGCYNGSVQAGYDFANKFGLPFQKQMPYKGQRDSNPKCATDKNYIYTKKPGLNFIDLSTTQIQVLLAEGPMLVSVSASQWQFYKGGIMRCSQNGQINHAAILAGFQNGAWIIRNSFGQDWGQDGYIRITLDTSNDCFVHKQLHMLSQSLTKYAFIIVTLFALLIIY